MPEVQQPICSPSTAWDIAVDLVYYVRQKWPHAGELAQAEALLLAFYGVAGPMRAGSVLACALPTVPNK